MLRTIISFCLLLLSATSPLFSATSSANDEHMNVLYKTTPQAELHLDLYYPEAKPKASGYPLVIYTHGGGWAAGSKEKAKVGLMGRVVEQLNKEGFCVAAVQYRLCTKEKDTTMRDCVIDAKDAIRFLSKHQTSYQIDPSQVYAWGDSAGGQMAQILLLSSPDDLHGDPDLAGYRYTMIAGVSWYGPTDFEDEQLFNHNDRENFRDRFGSRILPPNSKPKDKQRLYREMSPVTYLNSKSPPLLIIQGDGDTTIPVKHAYRIQEVAADVNAPVEVVIVKNAGHNWRKADGVTEIEPGFNAIVSKTVAFIVEQR